MGPGARPCAPPSGCPWSRELLAAPSNDNSKNKAEAKQSKIFNGNGNGNGRGNSVSNRNRCSPATKNPHST
ncbi:hypothetical protein [Lysobacter gummosus]|uniref:hypothetical protein n=1 Tax=Lysobacter gummosus TaxID=262324 RepID=UPI003635CEE7